MAHVEQPNPTAAPKAKQPGCACGCWYFVWWIREQGRYSSETPWECYDQKRHLRAVCLDCSRDVPRTPTKESSDAAAL
jgi:hypothetical protein